MSGAQRDGYITIVANKGAIGVSAIAQRTSISFVVGFAELGTWFWEVLSQIRTILVYQAVIVPYFYSRRAKQPILGASKHPRYDVC